MVGSLRSGSLLLVVATVVSFLGGCAAPGARRGVPEEVVRQNILGTAYLGQQNWTEAEAAFRKGLKQRPRDPLLLNNVSVALVQQGRVDEAEALLEQALVADPEHPYAHYNLGLLSKSRGDFAAAATHFEAVERFDDQDLMTLYNLGVTYSRTGREDEAEAAFRGALELDPAHVSSLYGLGRLLLQRGDQEEGARLIGESQRIRARSGLDEAVGSQYGEQGPYALGAEYPGDVLSAPPAIRVSFRATEPVDEVAGAPPPVAVTRLAPEGRPAAVVAGGGGLARLDEEGKLAPLAAAPAADIAVRALAAGDLDNDGVVELVVLAEQNATLRPELIEHDESGAFEWIGGDAFSGSAAVPVSEPLGAVAMTFVDRDHDGDLDLFWCWSTAGSSGCRLATNDGAGHLEARPSTDHGLGIDAAGEPWLAVGLSDYDNDRDIDLLLADRSNIHVFTNQRDGTFEPIADRIGLQGVAGDLRALAVADLNKDSWMDLVVADGRTVRLLANRRGKFAAPVELATRDTAVRALAVLDADNDGFLDLFLTEEAGTATVYRNVGRGEWTEKSDWLSRPQGPTADSLLVLDGDLDGDLDLVAAGPRGVWRWTNGGGNANHWIVVDSRGVGDNRFGVGAKVEVLAGALRQKFELTGPAPLHVGLGSREAVESVRHLWPSGVLQDEIGLQASDRHEVRQLDRKGTSCPLLYARGEGQWRFVTDFLGGCAIGYLHAPGVYGTPDTDEYVKIEGGLADSDGFLRLRLNNQLQEVIWFDQTELVVVDHPVGSEVFPNERLMPGPPWPEFELFASRTIRPVVSARGVDDGLDLGDKLRTRDRRTARNFELLPFKGYAEHHTIELDLGPFDAGERVVLLLDGWIDYADSSANLAAHQAGVRLSPPRLRVADGLGGWRETGHRMGFPAGLPKTMAVELTGLFPSANHRLRIDTNMRVYWDQVRVLLGGEEIDLRVRRLQPLDAELRYGGFPEETSPDGRPPFAYDPERVAPVAPWKAHVGRYTAFGDVRELLTRVDDRFVTTRAGDEIELRFSAPQPPAPGWTRTYLLYADGFGKDMDPNSAANAEVGPLPFHGMPGYPYPEGVTPPSTASAYDRRARVVPDSARGWPGALPQALAGGDHGDAP